MAGHWHLCCSLKHKIVKTSPSYLLCGLAWRLLLLGFLLLESGMLVANELLVHVRLLVGQILPNRPLLVSLRQLLIGLTHTKTRYKQTEANSVPNRYSIDSEQSPSPLQSLSLLAFRLFTCSL